MKKTETEQVYEDAFPGKKDISRVELILGGMIIGVVVSVLVAFYAFGIIFKNCM